MRSLIFVLCLTKAGSLFTAFLNWARTPQLDLKMENMVVKREFDILVVQPNLEQD